MSGIAGFIHFDGRPADEGTLAAMLSSLAHRGPDATGQWLQGPAGLAHCLLRTTPQSLGEVQPLHGAESGLVMVMDGRVDNREELLGQLRQHGVVPDGTTDPALVLSAYERWGGACLDHIDGDFAFAIWDSRKRRVFCARDRFGIKPLVYHWDGKTFSFASEVGAILALPRVTADLDERLVAEFLGAAWQAQDATFWAGIKRLPPSCRMIASADGLKIDNYWKPSLEISRDSDADNIVQYRGLLFDAVKRLSRSHVPLACEVSGGLDSSAIFAIASRLGDQGDFGAPGLAGFTLTFEEAPEADELAHVQAVSAFTGQPVQAIAATFKPLDWYRQRALRTGDFPSYPNGVMGIGIREAAAASGARVLLTGNGGDELLLGDPQFYASLFRTGDIAEILRVLRDDVTAAGIPVALWRLLRRGALPAIPDGMKRVLGRGPRIGNHRAWLSPQLAQQLAMRASPDAVVDPAFRFLTERLLEPFALHAHEFEERLASECRIELRHPFLTRALAEHCFRMPPRLRTNARFGRAFHRRAMAGLLPTQVLERTDKADFMVTMRRPMPGVLEAIETAMRQGALGDWLDMDKAKSVLAKARDNNVDGWPEFMVWTLFGCMCARGYLSGDSGDISGGRIEGRRDDQEA